LRFSAESIKLGSPSTRYRSFLTPHLCTQVHTASFNGVENQIVSGDVTIKSVWISKLTIIRSFCCL
jgi:hypothetical protein